MADIFFQNGRSYISAMIWDRPTSTKIWHADRHWPSEESGVTQSEIGNKIAPQRPPSWKSIRRHISAASDPIWAKRGMLTQNDMTITAMRSKSKLKNMMDWKQ